MSDFNIPKATLCTFACAGLVCARGRSFVASLFLVSVGLMSGHCRASPRTQRTREVLPFRMREVKVQTVPRVIRLCGTLKDSVGKPITGPSSMTISLYSEERGGNALFVENQAVQLDETGHYDVLLSSTLADGLPPDLLQSNEPRWLGIQIPGVQEERRIARAELNQRGTCPEVVRSLEAERVGPSRYAARR